MSGITSQATATVSQEQKRCKVFAKRVFIAVLNYHENKITQTIPAGTVPISHPDS